MRNEKHNWAIRGAVSGTPASAAHARCDSLDTNVPGGLVERPGHSGFQADLH